MFALEVMNNIDLLKLFLLRHMHGIAYSR